MTVSVWYWIALTEFLLSCSSSKCIWVWNRWERGQANKDTIYIFEWTIPVFTISTVYLTAYIDHLWQLKQCTRIQHHGHQIRLLASQLFLSVHRLSWSSGQCKWVIEFNHRLPYWILSQAHGPSAKHNKLQWYRGHAIFIMISIRDTQKT